MTAIILAPSLLFLSHNTRLPLPLGPHPQLIRRPENPPSRHETRRPWAIETCGGRGFAKCICLTPHYMSPEMLDQKSGNSKSDIWILESLIYELCVHLHHCMRLLAPGGTLSMTSSLSDFVIEATDLEAVLLFGRLDFPTLQTLGI